VPTKKLAAGSRHSLTWLKPSQLKFSPPAVAAAIVVSVNTPIVPFLFRMEATNVSVLPPAMRREMKGERKVNTEINSPNE
jgi:hypothetical protein